MDPKTAALGIFLLRQLMHCIFRWSSERLLQNVDIDNLERLDLLLAMEDMLRQIRRDYHSDSELFFWEFIADFHREYRDPGIMSKWQYINAFIPAIPQLVESAPINIFQNAFTPVNPSYSPSQLHLQSVPVVDEVPSLVIPTTPTIPRSHSQPDLATTNHSIPSPNTDNALTGKLSANARARLLYKPSPFYQCVMALSPPHYGRATKNESVLSFKLQVSSSLVQQLKSNPHFSIMLFCANNDNPTSQYMLMEFPNDCYIRVNKQTLDWRPRGVIDKPGTFTPADITRFCHLQESRTNDVELRYSNASKIFHASLHLVCPINAKAIVDTLLKDKFVSKEAIYQALEKKIKDDDIMELSSTLSLKCPLGVQRIEVPCRSSNCQHLQCFDAFTFLGINEQVQQWICPVCNRNMDSWDEIIVDGYYMDILESTPKSLENVSVHPDGKWEIPPSVVPVEIDDSASVLTDSESSSSGSTSHGTDGGTIYVIDDDDDEDNQGGSNSSCGHDIHSATWMESSIDVGGAEVRGTGSKDRFKSPGRQETQTVKSFPLLTISPTPASTLSQHYESSTTFSSRSQRIPEKCQIMDLTLCPPDDVIDLTSDNEDKDENEEDGENEEGLVLHRRKRSFAQPNNSHYKTNDITLASNNNGNTSRGLIKSRRVSHKRDNQWTERATNKPEPDNAHMEDESLPIEAISAPGMRLKDPRRVVQEHTSHPYHTGDLQSTLPPLTPLTPTLIPMTSPSPSTSDLILLQFETAPYMNSSLDTIMEGPSGHSGEYGVSESAILSWPTDDPTFTSPYLSYSPGIFGQTNEGDDSCRLFTQADDYGGGLVGGGGGSEERPSKRPYTASVPSHLGSEQDESADRLQSALDHETSDRLKSVLKQYLTTPDIFL